VNRFRFHYEAGELSLELWFNSSKARDLGMPASTLLEALEEKN
jgi:hypothetical protein